MWHAGLHIYIYIFATHEEASLERSSSWWVFHLQKLPVWGIRLIFYRIFLKWDWIQRWNGKIPKSRWWTVLSWGDTHGLHPLIPKKHMPPADVLLHAGGAGTDIFFGHGDILLGNVPPPKQLIGDSAPARWFYQHWGIRADRMFQSVVGGLSCKEKGGDCWKSWHHLSRRLLHILWSSAFSSWSWTLWL